MSINIVQQQIQTIIEALSSDNHERLVYDSTSHTFLKLSRSEAKRAKQGLSKLEVLKGKIAHFVRDNNLSRVEAEAMAQAFHKRIASLSRRKPWDWRGRVTQAKENLEACAQAIKEAVKEAEQMNPYSVESTPPSLEEPLIFPGSPSEKN